MMSPFSLTFKALRVKRNLSQMKAADLLGVEQSYLSAIERGHKFAPKNGFVDVVTLKYQLDGEEEIELIHAYSNSRHNYMLSHKAPIEAYEIFTALETQAEILNVQQITLIKIALGLEDIFPKSILKQQGAPKM